MIRINLLPFRAARKQENIKQQVLMFVLVFILVLTSLYVTSWQFGRVVLALENDLQTEEARLEDYKAKAKEAKELEEQIQKVVERIAQIGKLKGNRLGPVQLLESMTGWVIKDDMWVTSLQNSPKKLALKGIAGSNKTVADFMSKLEQSGQFKEVTLLTVQLTPQGMRAQKLKTFDIICLKPSAEDEKGGGKK